MSSPVCVLVRFISFGSRLFAAKSKDWSSHKGKSVMSRDPAERLPACSAERLHRDDAVLTRSCVPGKASFDVRITIRPPLSRPPLSDGSAQSVFSRVVSLGAYLQYVRLVVRPLRLGRS